ncbi:MULTISPECIES: hypothetical protein [unclassified Microbulbifer]|uniref:hypothetical protein n=1 Tax=unclassified Microbulbifer TaxID=2619833 RepID=UPI0027E3EFB5|nr:MULTISPECIES: hypothetical protein [unclassified Microbulbifer]
MKHLVLFCITVLAGCSSIYREASPLERHYGEKFYAGEMFYEQAVWFSAEPEHQFSISQNTLYLYDHHYEDESKPNFYKLNIDNCDGIRVAIDKLKNSTVSSVARIAGVEPIPDPEVAVLDGDWMKLRINNIDAGYFELNGSSSTQFTVPWIESAQEVFNVGHSCAKERS